MKSINIDSTGEAPDNIVDGFQWAKLRLIVRLARNVIDDKFPDEKGMESLEKKYLTAILVTALGFQVDWAKLRDYEGGRGEFMDARHFICWLMNNKMGVTSTDIGYLINRHHSTVLMSIKKVSDIADVDSDFNSKTKTSISILNHILKSYD